MWRTKKKKKKKDHKCYHLSVLQLDSNFQNLLHHNKMKYSCFVLFNVLKIPFPQACASLSSQCDVYVLFFFLQVKTLIVFFFFQPSMTGHRTCVELKPHIGENMYQKKKKKKGGVWKFLFFLFLHILLETFFFFFSSLKLYSKLYTISIFDHQLVKLFFV